MLIVVMNKGGVMEYLMAYNVSSFSIASLKHERNGARLLSPQSECTSCVKSCRATWKTGSWEIRKFQEIPEMFAIQGECWASHSKL